MALQRYRVLERIDFGGMAEVFKGVSTSMEGFTKPVAIKRVLPSLTHKRKFVRMFLDEARLSLVLNHANIVQVFDLGHADDAYFIVMEYVEGINLKDALDEAFRHELPIPVAQATFIAAEVCKALSYAHEKRDAGGEPLHIVHRDVSPPNVLLSLRGEVKVADFGLAKARSQLEHTDPGLVKGKFGYLSPEAAYGEPIDLRTDIFALGIVLWEMLAARRLFVGETEPATLELVRRARVPSLREINPDVPPELEAVIMRALARDRSRRYDSAEELGNALIHVLFDHGLRVTNSDIAQLVGLVVESRGGLPTAPPSTSDEHVIEQLIQEEIDRFIPIDAPSDDFAAIETGGFEDLGFEVASFEEPDALEDPSQWFSDEDVTDMDARGLVKTAQKVGPGRTRESLLIPIDVVQDALEARAAKQAEARKSEPVPPPAPSTTPPAKPKAAQPQPPASTKDPAPKPSQDPPRTASAAKRPMRPERPSEAQARAVAHAAESRRNMLPMLLIAALIVVGVALAVVLLTTG